MAYDVAPAPARLPRAVVPVAEPDPFERALAVVATVAGRMASDPEHADRGEAARSGVSDPRFRPIARWMWNGLFPTLSVDLLREPATRAVFGFSVKFGRLGETDRDAISRIFQVLITGERVLTDAELARYDRFTAGILTEF